jgi:hypothetical protein
MRAVRCLPSAAMTACGWCAPMGWSTEFFQENRYKALGLWGRDPRLPRSGYERLRAGLVSGGLVSTGAPYETAVDNSLAELVIAEDPSALTR